MRFRDLSPLLLPCALSAAMAATLFTGCYTATSAALEVNASATPTPAPPDPDPGPPVDTGEVCSDSNPMKNLYFGDLHVHTYYSLDSFSVANRNDPKDAYEFARGTRAVRVGASFKTPGPEVKIDRPLDFAAVTDHSEFLNVIATCLLEGDAKNARYDAKYCAALRKAGSPASTAEGIAALFQLGKFNPQPPIICRGTDDRRKQCLEAENSIWQRIQDAANAANDRCKFTTFKAYEWSAQDGKANLHRNVIFRGDKVPSTPFDFLRYPKAMDLWQALSRECKSSEGCDALTIPHNANASLGKMWDTWRVPGAEPYMRRYQKLTEVFQHKGSSECLSEDPTGDPGCDYEVLRGSFLSEVFGFKDQKQKDPGRGYVRAGLAQGLSYAAKNHVNPLEMGIIGSTDTHNGTPGNVKESTWPGHIAANDLVAASRLGLRNFNPGGLTAVWAEQNTRDSIFAALKRREVYGTSGPRMAVRFFEVADVADDAAAQRMCEDPMFPKQLLAAGATPMGSVFPARGKPYLFVYALKDETELAQIDLIKLSSNAAGKPSVKVKNFPLTGPSATHACVFWKDQAFNPQEPTLYYARVLEQPSWRWSHYDCLNNPRIDPKVCTDRLKHAKGQERAWTSPVFSDLSGKL